MSNVERMQKIEIKIKIVRKAKFKNGKINI